MVDVLPLMGSGVTPFGLSPAESSASGVKLYSSSVVGGHHCDARAATPELLAGGRPRLFEMVAKLPPLGHSTGPYADIVVGNGHSWDGHPSEAEEHLGSFGTAERLVDQQLPNH